MKISLIALAFLVACNGSGGNNGDDAEMDSSTVDSNGLKINGSNGIQIGNQNGETFQGLKIRAKELTGPKPKDKPQSHNGKPLTMATPTEPGPQNDSYVQYASGQQVAGIATGLERLENVATVGNVTFNESLLFFITSAFAAVGTKTLGANDLAGARAGTFFKKQVQETSQVQLKTLPDKSIHTQITKKDGRALRFDFTTSPDDTCAILDAALGEHRNKSVLGKTAKGDLIGNPLGGNACSREHLNNFVLLNIYPDSDKHADRWALLVEKAKAGSSRLWLFEVTPSAQQSQTFRKRLKAFL